MPANNNGQWTEQRTAILKKEWLKGSTAKRIAEILGGVSRNGVIAKAHRMKLPGRASPIANPERYTERREASRQETLARKKVAGAGQPRRRGVEPFAWTEDRSAILMAGYNPATARSVSDIAADLGCSENTVYRRVAELGLTHPWNGRRPHLVAAGEVAPMPSLARRLAAQAPQAAPASLDLPLGQLEVGQCRFPTSPHKAPRGQHRFCGGEIALDPGMTLRLPYCAFHQCEATRPATAYERDLPQKVAA